MNKEKITELYRSFELTKDDVFKHKHYLIIKVGRRENSKQIKHRGTI